MIHAFPCPPRAATPPADAKTPFTPTPGATLGLEMEMVVARRGSGLSHPVVRYFDTLAGLKRGRDATARVAAQGGRDIAVLGEHGVSGVDNGFNLLETSFAPVAGQAGGLDRLARQVWRELADARRAGRRGRRAAQRIGASCLHAGYRVVSPGARAPPHLRRAGGPSRLAAPRGHRRQGAEQPLHLRAGGAGLPRP